MDALKKFLNKKRADTKFKQAGPGHKLSDTSGPSGSSAPKGQSKGKSSPQQHSHRSVSVPTDEKKQAAAAALARLEKNKRPEANPQELLASRQLAFIKEQAKKEIENERRLKELELQKQSINEERSATNAETDYTFRLKEEANVVDPKSYIVDGVYFTCPIIGPEVLPKAEIEFKIREFLLEQPREEIGVTSCLVIYSCNKPREKVTACVDTLCKYLDNIITNPDDPKFQKIRCVNKVYQERVSCVEGTNDFLEAAGFVKQMVTGDSGQEEFWVFSQNDPETYTPLLIDLRDTLQQTTPIKPDIDRNLQVLMPVQVKERKELPPDFYVLSPEELKREQQLKSELVERETTLRTKAQRERDELREQRKYRYCVIRIRFPDGFTLQGTFGSREKIIELYNFVKDCLTLDTLNFSLRKSGGESLDNMDSTLAECRLPPASVVNFNVSSAPASLATGEVSYLKPELLELVQTLE